MASIHKALKPGGQVVVIDFVREKGQSTDWVMNHVRAGQDVFTKEIEAAGFKRIGEEKFLKENYFIRFEKVKE
jgi:predicted methyltransferase